MYKDYDYHRYCLWNAILNKLHVTYMRSAIIFNIYSSLVINFKILKES